MRDKETEKTANSVREAVQSIQGRAKKSVKFRFAFKQLVRFLTDIEHSSVSTVVSFLRLLGQDMLNRPDTWFTTYVHTYARSRTVPTLLLETTYATYSLFMREGAGVSPYVTSALWREKNQSFNAAMTLLMCFAIEKCAPGCVNEINVTEERGSERILDGIGGLSVRRVQNLSGRRTEDLFRDKMMLFVMLNQLSEYIESSWSVDRLERVFWALTDGIRFLEKSKFQELELLRERDNADLTEWDPRVLLSFSLSGMIRFVGENDYMYRLTASSEAKVEIIGRLPRLTVQDLLDLNIVKIRRTDGFTINALPGSGKLLEVARAESRLSVRETNRNTMFRANVREYIG